MRLLRTISRICAAVAFSALLIAAYQFSRDTDRSLSPSSLIAVISAPSPYVHQNLQGNDTFYYAVTALNAHGESPLSAEVSAIPRLFSGTPQKIVAYNRGGLDFFGSTVSISGDYAIVGAPYEDTGGIDAGAAYIYRRTGTNTWDAGTKIMASDAEAHDWFGYSVSISGDYAIVGAYDEDTGGTAAGAAYIYRRTGTNTWDGGMKIVASDAQAYDLFGYSVSISGDYAIVGAHSEDGGPGDPLPAVGAAYLY